MSGLRRGALVFGILSLLLFADGAYLLATNNNVGGDTGTLAGNQNYYLNAGTVVVLSGVLVFAASVIMWLVDIHRQDKERERRLAGRTASRAPAGDQAKSEQAGDPAESEQAGPSGRTASRA